MSAETFDHVLGGLASLVVIIFIAGMGSALIFRVLKGGFDGKKNDKR